MKTGIISLATYFLIAFAVAAFANPALAQSTDRKIGTQFTVTADPLVARPHVKPCVVPLFTNYQFALFSETNQNFSFAPPAHCSGPWQKVVLDVNFSENAGIQYDRTASLYLANTNLYFGTTPEPLSNATNTWHIERDVTDYSALFGTDQQGTFVLQNCTGEDCGADYSYLNGAFTVSAQLEFYPAAWRSPVPRTPDMVLPMTQSNGSGGVNLPLYLTLPPNDVSTAFNLPANIEGAYLDVIAQSQQVDEQWYACFPNDLSNINELFGCGNTDFRETEVSIDGQPAGIAPVSPWVFTGFLPDQWVPIPGVQTLDFVPYRVDLTPFAGVLSDGQPHTITLSVFDQNYYFSLSASLLLYLDHDSAQVTGKVIQNTLSTPSPKVTENLQGTSTVTGTIGVSQKRNFTIAGYINTSHGRVTNSVSQEQNFSSSQQIDFDTVNFSVLDQNTSVNNSVNSLSTSFGRDGFRVTSQSFSFPISVDVVLPVSSAEFGLTVVTKQDYHASKLVLNNGRIEDYSTVDNSAAASDVSPASSSQHYTSFGLGSQPYDCQIASANNTLTKVSFGCNH
ncbi:MAG TPA: peptide-N4-asparagine amidase [Terriglobales bacterium]|nr:peptide-N4-asparagine amidase [Terriglobales bacterium]